MSFWTDIRDSAENIATLGMYDPKESRKAEAMQRYAINDQINAYKEQTELTRQQLQHTRDQEQSENRRIQEKQIRGLRRNYRSSSIGGSLGGNEGEAKLGG